MAEEMTFLPRKQVLSLEELGQISEAFVSLGVKKIRVTGGEPLVRANILQLIRHLGQMRGLQQLALTSNGSQLTRMAGDLQQAGIQRINISLDTLDAARFKQLTRTGDLDQVLAGIESAREAGFERIKINSVILKGRNDDEIIDLVNFCRERQLDLSFIEEMPLGNINEHDRAESYMNSDEVKQIIDRVYPLTASTLSTGGPSRYHLMADSDSRIGFISPHSHNFCGDCNRVRVTTEGRLLLCLGNEHSVDLRAVLRANPGDTQALRQTIIDAMHLKPERHYFDQEDSPQIVRFMNMTGG
jgi:cyclic pyranopterin phosphate synthase